MNDAQTFWNGAQAQLQKIKEPWRALLYALVLLVLLWIIPGLKKFAIPIGIAIIVAWSVKYFKTQGAS